MSAPKMIGTVNGFVLCRARLGRKPFTFNGTIKGLTLSALAAGAKPGATVYASFGGGERPYTIEPTPYDLRANGFWAFDKR